MCCAEGKGKNKRKSGGGEDGGGKKGKKGLDPADAEALKKREERFKAAPVDPEEAARRKARAERFGGAA